MTGAVSEGTSAERSPINFSASCDFWREIGVLEPMTPLDPAMLFNRIVIDPPLTDQEAMEAALHTKAVGRG